MHDDDYCSIKDRAVPQLFKIPGVNVVGIGGREQAGRPTGERAIKVFVTCKKPLDQVPEADWIPRSFEGVPTDVVEGGPLKRSSNVGGAPDSRSLFPDIAPYDPLRGGISLAIEGQKGLGTLGCFLWDRNDSTAIYALTNHHVVAEDGKLSRSRRILHPGLTDASIPPAQDVTDQTAFGIVAAGARDKLHDAAVVRLDRGTRWVPFIHEIGFVAGTHTVTQAEADAGPYEVRKRGATTKLTGGVVSAIDATIKDFFVGQVKTTVRAMVIRPKVTAAPDTPGQPGVFSDEGDSGSAVVNDNNEVVGLLFGSDRGTTPADKGIGYAIPIARVLQQLEEVDHLQLEVARPMTATPTLQTEEQIVSPPGGKPHMSGVDQIARGDHGYYRPLVGGAPILVWPMLGFANASTLGCVVTDRADASRAYILTAFSALSAGNTRVPTHDTRIGQPDNTGPCCSCTSNTVGRFFKGGPNDQTPQVGLVELDGQRWLAEVPQVGLLKSSREVNQADVGEGIAVVKYGGGSGLTGGLITKVEVVDGQKRLIIKPNANAAAGAQVLYFSQSADRGSVVVDGANQVVGVVYDEIAITGEHDMHSVAAPIEWVLNQLQTAGVSVEVSSAMELNDVRQAASARVIETDGLPIATPAIVSVRPAIDDVLLSDRWREHEVEVRHLIQANRRVAAAWRRHGGPALAQAAVRAFYFPAERIPLVSDGLPVALRIEQLSKVLYTYGSAELRATLSKLSQALPAIAGLSLAEAFRLLTEAVGDVDR